MRIRKVHYYISSKKWRENTPILGYLSLWSYCFNINKNVTMGEVCILTLFTVWIREDIPRLEQNFVRPTVLTGKYNLFLSPDLAFEK
jgi:hypothetical protein